MSYVYLGVAIITEVVATVSLKESKEFSLLGPSLIVVLGYATAFYFMSLSMKTIPVAISYAIWSGVGIAMITVISAYRFQQTPTPLQSLAFC